MNPIENKETKSEAQLLYKQGMQLDRVFHKFLQHVVYGAQDKAEKLCTL